MPDALTPERMRLAGNFLEFTKTFFYLRTGRLFDISYPVGRQSHYLDISRELTGVFQGINKRLIINIAPRYGKAVDINTPILTREGWTIAGDIAIGDEVVGSNGWTKVTGVYPQGVLEAKLVIFSDNQSVVCNADHLWNVCDRYTPTYKTMTTEAIDETIYEADGRKHWKIPLIDGEYGHVSPVIDPYLLGCWLGDGHSHYAAITTMDEEIVKAFENDGHTLRKHNQDKGKASTYGIIHNGFQVKLRQIGQFKNKHFPEDAYLWSKNDRLALLQGLMDTDGTCGKNGQVSFTNVNQSLIDGVGYLVNSLGGIYRIYKRASGTQTLNIRLPDELSPFRLERKKQYVSSGMKCSPRRFIANIIDVDPCEMVCFSVDAPNKLFAVGEGLILTHNSELVIHFVAWSLAHYPDSNFMYVSYSHSLAKKMTQTIRDIVSMPHYKALFGVELKGDTTAKDNFETTAGGTVYAVGAGGTVTGRGAGVKSVNRFGGCIVIDDITKPDEATSDTIREGINEWYYNTLQSRVNSPNTPIIFIGQRVHEDDLAANLIATKDWNTLILPSLDASGNALHPQMHDVRALKKLQEESPYIFAAQYQQDPQPAGGGIFKNEWWVLHEYEPSIIETFITCDTAETDKDYNDATVFSFWGVYRVVQNYVDTGVYALHWLDCWELRIEPKDLQANFLDFYRQCTRYKIRPRNIYIEKKSTGVTLLSTLKNMQGLTVMDIVRDKKSKTERFLEAQPYVSSRRVSLPKYSRHTDMCIKHMGKLTANNSHRFDDIGDTMCDAVHIALVKEEVGRRFLAQGTDSHVASIVSSKLRSINAIKGGDVDYKGPFH